MGTALPDGMTGLGDESQGGCHALPKPPLNPFLRGE
jgi:hypothetical protein